MTWAWQPHWKHERVDMERCRAPVHNDFGANFHQCIRKGVVEEDGMLWCKQHAPSAAKKRQEESDKRYRAQSAARSRQYRRSEARDAVADTAIKYFRQQATLEELEQAVTAYEALVQT